MPPGGAALGAGAQRVAAGRAHAAAVAAAGRRRGRAQEHPAALHQHAHRQAEAALRGEASHPRGLVHV